MSTEIAPPRLGQHVLMLIDNAAGLLNACRTITTTLPDLAHTSFTLLCCCPTHYWEHSGAENPDVKHEIEEVSKAEEAEFHQADFWLKQARAIFEAAGVPASNLLTKTALEDTLLDAALAELGRTPYSGIIVNQAQLDIVNRLQGKGFTDRFRHLPKVEVWSLNMGA